MASYFMFGVALLSFFKNFFIPVELIDGKFIVIAALNVALWGGIAILFRIGISWSRFVVLPFALGFLIQAYGHVKVLMYNPNPLIVITISQGCLILFATVFVFLKSRAEKQKV